MEAEGCSGILVIICHTTQHHITGEYNHWLNCCHAVRSYVSINEQFERTSVLAHKTLYLYISYIVYLHNVTLYRHNSYAFWIMFGIMFKRKKGCCLTWEIKSKVSYDINYIHLVFRGVLFVNFSSKLLRFLCYVCLLTLSPRKLEPSTASGAGTCLYTMVRSDFRALRALFKISCSSSTSFTVSLFTCCKWDEKRRS